MIDRKKYLDANEVKRLRTVTAAKSITDLDAGRVGGVMSWMIVDLALSTGLRVSEMAELKLQDISLKRRYITVHRLKRRTPYRESLAIGRELVKHLRTFTKWKRERGEPMKNDSPLFLSKRKDDDGKLQPLTAQGLQWVWKAAVRRAGLPAKLTIHSARHTMAVHLLRKTKNLKQVQQQLGHTSITTTASAYALVPFEDMADGVTGLYA